MKTAILLAVAIVTLSGCATVGGGHALATPWGAGGVYTFRDNPVMAGEPSARSVDIQVAKALNALEQQQSSNPDVRVAAR
jgi:hypothetical protein